jgi:peroxiredoxin
VKAVRVFASALFLVAVGVKAEGLDALFSATMKDPQGEAIELSQFRGKPLIVSFWARWCVPCREEFPEFMALRKKYKNQGLTVLGIALEDDPVKVREFLTAYQVDYPAALAGDQGIPLIQALGNNEALLPFTLLIDRKGEIVLSKRGVFKKSDFQGVAKKLLR